jgi:thioredoxin 1
MTKKVNKKNFKKEVLDFDGVVMVDFWAIWCVPCRDLGPVIDEVAEIYKDNKKIKIVKLDIDESVELAQEYSIFNIPALKFFKGGKIIDEVGDLKTKELIIKKINELIE